ncbi:MAG: regulatory protein RecX [Candidatus Omnitrophota bacterium]
MNSNEMSKPGGTEKAFTYAQRLLGIRPRSEEELTDKFRKKGYSGADVFQVVSSLKEKGIIDDSRFARLWIESRLRSSPKGEMLLRRELKQKGISSEIIEKALSENKVSEDSTARMIAAKKMASLKGVGKMKAKKRLFDFLARRGFNSGTIEDIINESFNTRDCTD